MSQTDHLAAISAYVDAHAEPMLEQLKTLVRQPSISAQDVGVKECAEHAGRDDARRRHRDPDPAHGRPAGHRRQGRGRARARRPSWSTATTTSSPSIRSKPGTRPPFEPTIRDGRLWGRGTGDNKGQLLAQLLAYRAWKKVAGAPPLNVTFIFEGEEESMSPHLAQFCRENRELLAADVVYTSDGPVHESGRYLISLGVRGVLTVELEARGANRDYHSGHGGNLLPNPAWEMVHLLSTMRAPDGRILIEGFYDDVRPIEPPERAVVDELPLDLPDYLARNEIAGLIAHPADNFFERFMFHPTLNVAGFTSGYGGQGTKTIIPSKAIVKIDMRLVVDQSADDIWAKFQKPRQDSTPRT